MSPADIITEGKRAKRLWFAVLIQAVEDRHAWLTSWKPKWQAHERQRNPVRLPPAEESAAKQAFLDYVGAMLWFREENERVGGFKWVCRLFDVEPARFVERLPQPEFVNQIRRALAFVEKQ